MDNTNNDFWNDAVDEWTDKKAGPTRQMRKPRRKRTSRISQTFRKRQNIPTITEVK